MPLRLEVFEKASIRFGFRPLSFQVAWVCVPDPFGSALIPFGASSGWACTFSGKHSLQTKGQLASEGCQAGLTPPRLIWSWECCRATLTGPGASSHSTQPGRKMLVRFQVPLSVGRGTPGESQGFLLEQSQSTAPLLLLCDALLQHAFPGGKSQSSQKRQIGTQRQSRILWEKNKMQPGTFG